MANRDDEFEPRLDKIGTRDTGLGSRYASLRLGLRDINRDVTRAGHRQGFAPHPLR
jgi:hypothetical protein